MNNNKLIIKDFVESKPVYDSLEQITNGLITTLLSNETIDVHSITSRCKTEKSLTGKVNRPEKNYEVLTDITDIVGLRITTYFADDVDIVSKIIEREFVIDTENSIDKRKAIEPDRFGYMSLHLVAEHGPARISLPEYKKFKGIKFEIQIRTILQHAWAEIEHDIGYKSSSQVPVTLRRRFSRLSGLLELADEEFLAIRNQISSYKTDLVESILQDPVSVELNLDSLETYVTNNLDVAKVEKEFTSIFGCNLSEPSRNMMSNMLGHLNSLDIFTIQDLTDAFNECKPYFIPFLIKWLPFEDGSKPTYESISKGISMLYVGFIILAIRDDEKYYDSFSKNSVFGSPQTIEKIKKTYSEIQSSQK